MLFKSNYWKGNQHSDIKNASLNGLEVTLRWQEKFYQTFLKTTYTLEGNNMTRLEQLNIEWPWNYL